MNDLAEIIADLVENGYATELEQIVTQYEDVSARKEKQQS